MGEVADPASAQLLSEQQKGTIPITNALNCPSIEEHEGPVDLFAQTPVAIINTCSLQGGPNSQRTVTGPAQGDEPKASPERMKRQVSANAPVSPSKRRLPVRGAAGTGRRGSGAGKLERPAYIYDDLSKTKARRTKEETSSVSEPAVRLLRSAKVPASGTTATTEAQNLPDGAANPVNGGRITRSRVPRVNSNRGEWKQAENATGEQLEQNITDVQQHAKLRMRKKSVECGVVDSVAPGSRTTRSGARHLGNSELKVVIPVPDQSKKPGGPLEARKGKGNKRPGKSAKPLVGAKPLVVSETAEHQDRVQSNRHAELSPGVQSPVTQEAPLGRRNSETDGNTAGATSSANVRRGQASGDRIEERNHTDGESPDAQSERAPEHVDEAEETVVAPSGPARSDITVNSGSPEAAKHIEGVDGDSDSGDLEESELSGFANVADGDDQGNSTVDGRSTADMPFGQQANWKRAMKSASTVGQSKRNGVIKNKKPRLATRAIKAIIGLSSELKQLFLQYGPLHAQGHLDESSSNRATTLQRDINRKLKKLKTMIAGINEADAGNQKRKIIRDIFAHAIPELVFLLNDVFLCYFSTSSPGMPELKPSLRVHELVLILCKKASDWEARPDTDRPIIRPNQSIFAVLRDMVAVFRTERRKIETSVSSQRQMLTLARQLEREQEIERREHQQYELEKDSFFERQKLALDMDEERIRVLRRKFTCGDVLRSGSSSMPSQDDPARETATSPVSDTPIERVEMFAPRSVAVSHPKPRDYSANQSHDLNNTAHPWTDEEREWLMVGLQIHRDPHRYKRVVEDFGQPGGPLQRRTFDDLVQRAREEKSNVEAQHEVPDWLESV